MVESAALIFKINNDLVVNSLEDISDADLWRRPSDTGSPLGWLVGHITESRSSLLTRLGLPLEIGWPRIFERGSQVQGADVYPGRSMVMSAWRASRRTMRDAFAALTPERLVEPFGRSLPGLQNPNIAELIAFIAFHESYHVGQMGYVRRLFGYKSLVG